MAQPPAARPPRQRAHPKPTKLFLGFRLFSDPKLSVSGKQTCTTCHVPSNAYASTDRLSVPLGGPGMNLPGLRNAPSLVYASLTPPFSIVDGSAVGGFFRDGRASSLAAQASQPFVTPFEMANANATEVVARLQGSPASLAQFVKVYGADALNDPDVALQDMAQAIAAYETDDRDFHPFSSKFDFWLQGKAESTAIEERGLKLFNDPTRGNCTACHPESATRLQRASAVHRLLVRQHWHTAQLEDRGK